MVGRERVKEEKMDMGKGKRPKKGSVGTREGEREREDKKCLFSPRERDSTRRKDTERKKLAEERRQATGGMWLLDLISRRQRSINDAGILRMMRPIGAAVPGLGCSTGYWQWCIQFIHITLHRRPLLLRSHFIPSCSILHIFFCSFFIVFFVF